MPTMSVVVASLTVDGLTYVQPPADVPPMAVTVEQLTAPVESVCKTLAAPLQLRTVLRSRLVPIPTHPEVTMLPAFVFTLPRPRPPVI